jgi:protein O-mannosyl-transferase
MPNVLLPSSFPSLERARQWTASNAALLLLGVALCLGWLAYSPGLGAGFLFDDYANLPPLGDTGPVVSWQSFARYISAGTADPTGRPLAMLSFLLDANNWPAQARPFTVTNVFIHLVNGILLFAVLRALGFELTTTSGKMTPAARINMAAAIGAAAWLLHPRFVSTTLYIVQREAMLAATFVLLGILGWIAGRRVLLSGRVRTGIQLEAGALVLFTTLATLTKANGALLPVLLLVLEYTILPAAREHHRSSVSRPWQWHARIRLSLWMATLAIGAYLLDSAWRGVTDGIPYRSWTMVERLLTEPRILCTYLRDLILPRPLSSGIFSDAYTISRNLLDPWTTIPAIAAVLVAPVAGICFRRRYPVIAAAVLFFFAGHLLESTSIALELYFEHRNYLPAMLLFWPLGMWFSGAWAWKPATDGRRALLTVVVLSGLAAMTYANASLWGDLERRTATWAALNPGSPRAQVSAAIDEMQQGRPGMAIARLQPILASHPDEVQVAFNLLSAHCQRHDASTDDIVAARHALATAHDPGALITSWYEQMVPLVKAGGCPGITLTDLAVLADAGASNPWFPAGRRQDLDYAAGLVLIAQGRLNDAFAAFNAGLQQDRRLDAALAQAAILGSAGASDLGLRHLAFYDTLPAQPAESRIGMPAIHAWILRKQDYWGEQRRALEATLRADSTRAR